MSQSNLPTFTAVTGLATIAVTSVSDPPSTPAPYTAVTSVPPSTPCALAAFDNRVTADYCFRCAVGWAVNCADKDAFDDQPSIQAFSISVVFAVYSKLVLHLVAVRQTRTHK